VIAGPATCPPRFDKRFIEIDRRGSSPCLALWPPLAQLFDMATALLPFGGPIAHCFADNSLGLV
jgi:hypothetical protein